MKKLQTVKELTYPTTTIIEAIQIAVNENARKNYPKQENLYYFVSHLIESKEQQKIILTVSHGDRCFSEVLFPEPDSYYGHEWLETKLNACSIGLCKRIEV